MVNIRFLCRPLYYITIIRLLDILYLYNTYYGNLYVHIHTYCLRSYTYKHTVWFVSLFLAFPQSIFASSNFCSEHIIFNRSPTRFLEMSYYLWKYWKFHFLLHLLYYTIYPIPSISNCVRFILSYYIIIFLLLICADELCYHTLNNTALLYARV